jgi:hypothetical protein
MSLHFSVLGPPFSNLLSGRLRFTIQVSLLFGQEMNHAGRSEFAVDFRITAVHAFCAHGDIVLYAGVRGFSLGVIHTMFQFKFSLGIHQTERQFLPSTMAKLFFRL